MYPKAGARQPASSHRSRPVLPSPLLELPGPDLQAPVRRVDLHVHVSPLEYLEGLPETVRSALPSWSPQLLTEHMERYRIDAAVLQVGPPGVEFGDLKQRVANARRINDWMSEFVQADARRRAGLAILPLPDAATATAEAIRGLDDLRLDGIALQSNYEGVYLGDLRLQGLWKELDDRAAYVFVHPCAPRYRLPLPSYPVWLFEFPFETTRTITDLIYSGVFERYSRIKFQFPHLGGATLSLAQRLDSLAERAPDLASAAPQGALHHLRQLFFDTGLANHVVNYRSALEVADVTRIGFGSDWPWASLPTRGSEPAPGLSALAVEEREMLDEHAASRLVPRLFQRD